MAFDWTVRLKIPKRNMRPWLAAVAALPLLLACAEHDVQRDAVPEPEALASGSLQPFQFVQDRCSISWMSLSVSADGETLAFDALGDIYTLPVGGGTARRLTPWDAGFDADGDFRGKPYSSQPTFAPDGERLAFISDRSGTEELWTVNRDGSDARKLTDFAAMRIASPGWSASGETIYFRRGTDRQGSIDFVDLQSLSVGTLDVEGFIDAQGPQGPQGGDGGAVLFSSPVGLKPGRPLRRENWQVFALDPQRESPSALTDEPGGAVRPLLSPNGRWLAFATWRDGTPALVVRSRDSGREHVVKGVERNLQDLFISQSDLFPGYAFAPDSQSVFVSVDGGPARVDLATGDVDPIRCSLETTIHLNPSARPPVDIAADRPRIALWMQPVPDSQNVVAEVAGQIWMFSRGASGLEHPRALTRLSDRAAQPSVSPDGKTALFVRLGPDRAGSVVRLDLATGAQTTVLEGPDYLAPRWLPDGRSFLVVEETGAVDPFEVGDRSRNLLVATLDGETSLQGPVRVGDEGVFPRGDGASALYLSGSDLMEMSLNDGGDRRRLGALNADMLAPSPDGKSLAVQSADGVRVIQTSLVEEAGDRPLRLNRLGPTHFWGSFPGWSDDGQPFWTVGTSFHQAEPDQTFAMARLPELGSRKTSDAAYVLDNATLLTMGLEDIIEQGRIVIRHGWIVEVGSTDTVEIPEDARLIDMDGRTLLPGYVDVHQHAIMPMTFDAMNTVPRSFLPYEILLEAGITSTREPAMRSEIPSAALLDLLDFGNVAGPRAFSSGLPIIYPEMQFSTKQEARSLVRARQVFGATHIKQYLQPSREHRQWVMAESARAGLRATFEGGYDYKHSITALLDGFNGTEHSVGNIELRDDAVALAAASGTDITPTIVTQIAADRYFQERNVADDPLLTRFVPLARLQNMAALKRRGSDVVSSETSYDALTEGAATLHDAGVRIGVGGHDSPAPTGLSTHWETWSLVDGGMTELEALESLTRIGAEIIGIDDRVGSLEVGKLADIVVLSSDPLQDIRNSRDIDSVVMGGLVVAGRDFLAANTD